MEGRQGEDEESAGYGARDLEAVGPDEAAVAAAPLFEESRQKDAVERREPESAEKEAGWSCQVSRCNFGSMSASDQA